MFGGLGVGELSIILVIVVVLFGAGRLAGIGSGLGKGIRNFKDEMDTIESKETKNEANLEEAETTKEKSSAK